MHQRIRLALLEIPWAQNQLPCLAGANHALGEQNVASELWPVDLSMNLNFILKLSLVFLVSLDVLKFS